MKTEKFDVIIIGAGMGGLSAGTHLAQAGKRVLILEHYVVPGGYAHEFTRGYYSFDVSLRALDGAAQGSLAYPALRDLGILQNVRFRRLDPFYTVQLPEHTISVSGDYLQYESMLIEQFPNEASGIRALINNMLRVYQDMRRFRLDKQAGRIAFNSHITEDYPDLLAATKQTWQAFMSQYVQDKKFQAAFSIFWNYTALPPSQLSAAIFILRWVGFHIFGAYYPEDGVMTLSWSLARTIKELGGVIQYRQTVNKIEVQNGHAVAVETNKGLRFEADVIISNANAPDTLLNLVGREYLPDDYGEKLDTTKPALSNLIVYLGLDRDLKAEGWNHHEFFTSLNYDSDAAYQAAQAGDFAAADMSITYYNVYYPTCAPKGGSVVSLYQLASFDYADKWGTKGDLTNYQHNQNYQEIKDQATTIMINRAEQYIPNLHDSIRYKEIATPLTNMRFSLNPNGSFSGSELKVDNTFDARLNPVTPIPNLFLAGAWVSEFGITSAMLSGIDTAHMVLEHLK